ncbi:MarR family transcriptional regulator [Streptomyces sp. SID685]|uniref:GbsR/MarR family transcriptional regulator n=1 Tax=Streptomyces sp. SID685 TaxID=2690322 RepID=UPI00136CC65E|nr:MarR family transcriptional regulator [Streptomyces sp. SID685]MYR83674.1 MarR family transcriptional regulator [Streptomyces sp. SID685]
MPQDTQLIFADRVGHFYGSRFGFPPMAGRLLGYLFVCDSPQQSIDQLSAALLASRSVVTDAVTLLASYRMVQRVRTAGERVDRVSLTPVSQQLERFFDSTVHEKHAVLYRAGLPLVADSRPARRAPLQEAIALAEFLAERLPMIMDEWSGQRDELYAATNRATPIDERSDAS